jgi:hypothetical protein
MCEIFIIPLFFYSFLGSFSNHTGNGNSLVLGLVQALCTPPRAESFAEALG